VSAPVVGAAVATVLALTWIAAGFWAFLLVGVAMLVGAAVGRVADGRLDLRALADAFRGGRSSS
jgi:uncharacterized membrane protein